VTSGTTVTIDVGQQQTTTVSFLRARLADGAPDPAFGTNGTVVLRAPNGDRLEPRALAVTNGGRFLTVAANSPTGAALVARYDAVTGATDTTFGSGGVFPVALRRVESIAERVGAPHVYLGGYDTSNRPAVARVWNHTTS
jgi:hypothetical protein